MKDFEQDGGDRMHGTNSYVKSRWDVTLNAKEKEFLKEVGVRCMHSMQPCDWQPGCAQISAETHAGRSAAAAPRKDPKEERREVLPAAMADELLSEVIDFSFMFDWFADAPKAPGHATCEDDKVVTSQPKKLHQPSCQSKKSRQQEGGLPDELSGLSS